MLVSEFCQVFYWHYLLILMTPFKEDGNVIISEIKILIERVIQFSGTQD